jgi:hypothetical protein
MGVIVLRMGSVKLVRHLSDLAAPPAELAVVSLL